MRQRQGRKFFISQKRDVVAPADQRRDVVSPVASIVRLKRAIDGFEVSTLVRDECLSGRRKSARFRLSTWRSAASSPIIVLPDDVGADTTRCSPSSRP